MEKDIIFIHIPKTAGNSIREAVFGPGLKTSHKLANDYRKDEWENKFSFCVVRNPYERVYSHYKYHVKSGYTGVLKKEHPLLNEYSIDKYIFELVCSRKGLFSSQYQFINHDFSEKKIDLIIRLERISSDIAILEEKIGRKLDIPYLNKSSLRQHYLGKLEWKHIEAINKAYHDEFEFFKYKKYSKYSYFKEKILYNIKVWLKRNVFK